MVMKAWFGHNQHNTKVKDSSLITRSRLLLIAASASSYSKLLQKFYHYSLSPLSERAEETWTCRWQTSPPGQEFEYFFPHTFWQFYTHHITHTQHSINYIVRRVENYKFQWKNDEAWWLIILVVIIMRRIEMVILNMMIK